MGWSGNKAVFSMVDNSMSTLFFLQRGFDRDAWENGRQGMDYLEDPPPVKEYAPPIEALPGQGTDGLSQWLMYIFIAAIVGVIIALIIRGIKKRKLAASTTKANTAPQGSDEEPTEVSSLQALYAAFESARAKGEYRNALRLLYRITLRKLDLKGLLVADPDKTNREYLSELRGNPLEKEFAQLTRVHEYRWYGGGDLPQGEFDRLVPLFTRFIDATDEN